MRTQPSRSGLKRQVSPTTAVIAVVVVIGIALVIGFRDTLFVGIGGPHRDATDFGTREEIQTPTDTKRVVNERLGVTLSHLPDYQGGGGLPVLSVMTGAAGGLQVGDVVTAVNGVAVRGPGSMPEIATETNKVPEGQKVTVVVRRNGQVMTVQVPRRASAPSTGGPGGMAGAGRGRRGPHPQ